MEQKNFLIFGSIFVVIIICSLLVSSLDLTSLDNTKTISEDKRNITIWDTDKYSEDDKLDNNWECKVFIRVEYKDSDVDEDEVIYLLVTSTLDNGNYDELSLEEVSRNFEFD